jgi:hypothetical protein
MGCVSSLRELLTYDIFNGVKWRSYADESSEDSEGEYSDESVEYSPWPAD